MKKQTTKNKWIGFVLILAVLLSLLSVQVPAETDAGAEVGSELSTAEVSAGESDLEESSVIGEETSEETASETNVVLGASALTITDADRSVFQKVSGFIGGQEYCIAVMDGEGTHYALTLGTDPEQAAAPTDLSAVTKWTVKAGRSGTSLQNDGNNLVCNPDQDPVLTLETAHTHAASGSSEAGSTVAASHPAEGFWTYQYGEGTGILSYTLGEAVWYLGFDPLNQRFFASADAADAAAIVLYTSGTAVGGFITKQPEAVPYYVKGTAGGQTPAYTISAEIPENAAVDIRWFLDGAEAAAGTWTLSLTDYQSFAVGVHDISAVITCEDAYGTIFREESRHVSFIVCTGVVPNSFLTFSDVHESFVNIGRAIQEIMTEQDGRIPALVICTGDWANVHPNVDKETTAGTYIPALKAQIGGIDTVFVSGNHENGEAASEASAAANLGYDGSGVIYNSETAVSEVSSTGNKDLLVFGINFDDIAVIQEDGTVGYSYENVIPKLQAFFERIKNNGDRKLVVISAHAGMHVLGVQAESLTDAWAGSASYNLDHSYEMVTLINQYVQQYGIDVIFLFGHDHSKKEAEFTLFPGGSITSTISYADRSFGTQELLFTYGHAGYITEIINGTEHYRFVRWTEDFIYHEFRQLNNATISNVVTRNTVPHKSPVTGDQNRAVIWIVLMAVALILAAVIVILIIKNRKSSNKKSNNNNR